MKNLFFVLIGGALLTGVAHGQQVPSGSDRAQQAAAFKDAQARVADRMKHREQDNAARNAILDDWETKHPAGDAAPTNRR